MLTRFSQFVNLAISPRSGIASSGGTSVSLSKSIIGSANRFDNRGDIGFGGAHDGGCECGHYWRLCSKLSLQNQLYSVKI